MEKFICFLEKVTFSSLDDKGFRREIINKIVEVFGENVIKEVGLILYDKGNIYGEVLTREWNDGIDNVTMAKTLILLKKRRIIEHYKLYNGLHQDSVYDLLGYLYLLEKML